MTTKFKKSEDTIRVNLYLNSELLELLDEYCQKRGITRSAGFACILYEHFNQSKAVNSMDGLLSLMQLAQQQNPNFIAQMFSDNEN